MRPFKVLRAPGLLQEPDGDVDVAAGGFPPDVHGLGAMGGGPRNQMDFRNLPSDRDQLLRSERIPGLTVFGQRRPPP